MHFLNSVQGSDLALKFTFQFLLRIQSQLPLSKVKGENSHRRNHDHHSGEQLEAETEETESCRRPLRAHGSVTRRVDPVVKSTSRSRVVLLLSHALRVK